jgi:hypothetical protein
MMLAGYLLHCGEIITSGVLPVHSASLIAVMSVIADNRVSAAPNGTRGSSAVSSTGRLKDKNKCADFAG